MSRWRKPAGPFVSLGDGKFALRLDPDERRVLAGLLPQFAEMLESPDDPELRRLFPTAYPDDPERDAEYQGLMRDELRTSRTSAMDRVISSLDGEDLDATDMQSWLQTLNAARLVLGTRLAISEDEDPTEGLFVPEPEGRRDGGGQRQMADTPEAAARFAYLWLSELLEAAVEAADDDLG
jgi:hypothetical protein